jgi:hypothetical protein
MLTINKCYTGFIVSMPIPQSKRKLIAATALFIAVGALTGAIATGGAATISFATTQGQQDGGGGATAGGQERIVQQGTVTSTQDPLPGHETHQAAQILPITEDGSIYSGVITYTATEPVEVVVYNVQDLNATEQAILNTTDDEDAEFGTLLTTQLDNQTSIVSTIITPPYGETPIPSASIPFAGNGLSLHTIDGTPFVASYAVSAQVVPAETQNNISNVTLTVTEEGDDAGDEEDADDGADEDAADNGADGAGNATDTEEEA